MSKKQNNPGPPLEGNRPLPPPPPPKRIIREGEGSIFLSILDSFIEKSKDLEQLKKSLKEHPCGEVVLNKPNHQLIYDALATYLYGTFESVRTYEDAYYHARHLLSIMGINYKQLKETHCKEDKS